MNDLLLSWGLDLLIFVKILFLIFLAIYCVFAVVVVRQVNIMTATLRLGLESFVRIIAYLHFIFAVGLLLIAVFAL